MWRDGSRGGHVCICYNSMNKVHKKMKKQKKLEHMLLEKQKELKGTGDSLGKTFTGVSIRMLRNG